MILSYNAEAARRLETIYSASDVVAQRGKTLRRLRLVRGERLIDISCGPGFLSRSLAEAVGPVLTMEFDEESRALLRQIRAVHVRSIERCHALIGTKR